MINYERLLYHYKGCKDNPEKAAHCKYWTIKGECTRVPQFMKNNCNQSCGFCSEYILQCFNGAKMCDLPCLLQLLTCYTCQTTDILGIMKN